MKHPILPSMMTIQAGTGNFRGQPMDPGVFVWVLEAKFADGHTEAFRGNTTLVR
jgi:hypothetical protein